MSKIIILYITSIIISICYSIPITKNSLNEDEELVKHGSKLIYSIVGGKSSSIAKHPYQVAILVNGTFQGAGIILDNNWVATLSSMVVEANVNDVTVKSGKDDYTQGTTTGVKKIIPHPQFSFYEMDNDLALLKLQKNLKFSKTVKKISIGPKPLKSGATVTISGWGDTESQKKGNENSFKEVSLDIVEHSKCQDAYSVKEITKSMVCAFKKNAGPCWYDFGDVIVSKNKAYGLFSWAKGCATKDAPGVYVDLVVLNSWIKSTIKKNSNMNEEFSLYKEEDNSKEILSPETVQKDEEIKVDKENTKLFEIEKLKKGLELTNKVFASKFNEVFADMKDIFSKHKHHYISKRSLLDNFLINDEDFIKAINKEEKEEENAEEEELEQEKEEEEVEKEAIEVVSEVQKGDRIGSNVLDEEEEKELNKIKYHAIVKRSIECNNDEETSDEETSDEETSDEEIEEAIKEEEEEEEHADEEEKEQEEAEDEAEEDAIKLIGKKMTKSNTEEQNVEDANEESKEEDDQEEDDSEESNADNNTKDNDAAEEEEEDDDEEEEEEEEEQKKSEEKEEEENDDDDESDEVENVREKALEGEESEEDEEVDKEDQDDDDAEEDDDEEEEKKEKELEKEENSGEEEEEEKENDEEEVEEEEEDEEKEEEKENSEEEEDDDDKEVKDGGNDSSEEEGDH